MSIPGTMQAVRIHAHGGVDALQYEQAAVPQVGPNDALVRVRACALNHLDIWIRIGARGWQIPMPHILGSDVAGEVVAVGSEVSHLSHNGAAPSVDNTLACIVHPGLPGGPSVERLRGDDNVAADYSVLGQIRDGGYAQYVCVPADNILPKPANLSWEEAAAFPLTFLTAWHMLGRRRADLHAGESVLVMGANSGVGAAAIQVARAKGAGLIIATASSEARAARAMELGADHVIDHYKQAGSIHKAVYEITSGQGVDVIVEHVGAAVFAQCVKALRRGGRLVTCGTTTGGSVDFDVQLLFAKHLSVLGSFMGSMSEMLELLPLVERGVLKPVVDKVLPLRQAAKAHQLLEESQHFGKIVLTPPE